MGRTALPCLGARGPETLRKAWHEAGVRHTALCAHRCHSVRGAPESQRRRHAPSALALWEGPAPGGRQVAEQSMGGGLWTMPTADPVGKGQECRSLAQFHRGGHVNTFGVTGPEFKRK